MTQAALQPREAPQARRSQPGPVGADLATPIRDLCATFGDAVELRTAVVDRLRTYQAERRAAITAHFLVRKRGLACAAALAELADEIVTATWNFALATVPAPSRSTATGFRLAVVAVGGYGRGTLAPGSDIDLLFLLPQKQAGAEAIVEAVLYILWDLKLKIGHATRSVDECLRQARADMTIRTAMLEARLICGDQPLFDELRSRFEKEIVAKTAREFVAAKLVEREARITKSGTSRYLVEPNVKEGKGGLRDLNTLFWISKYVYRVRNPAELVGAGLFTPVEFGAFHRCEEFLWRVRCQLHLAAGRAEERLSFDYQRILAEQLGYRARGGLSAVERFMKHYFLIAKTVGDLTAIVCAALEEKEAKPPAVFDRLVGALRRPKSIAGTRDFAIELDRVTVARRDAFARDPLNLIRLFWIADHYGLAIHPDAARLVTLSLKLIDGKLRADPEANRLFMEILTSRNAPERTLRRMNEAGVLGRFIPEFGRVVALMQFNMYHHYTVDEHLLRSVGILSDIDAGRQAELYPLASAEVMPKIANRAALYLATFLHDVAKGREEDHSKAGATVARRLAKRFGFGEAERDLVGWLVENHLLMSNVAQMRDLADPRTIDIFAEQVGSVERLRCLHILTLCDITAVGPGVWNGWKGELMRTLYRGAEGALSGSQSSLDLKKRVWLAQDELRPFLAGWPAAEREAYMGRHYPTYWLRVDVERKARHAELLRTVPGGAAPVVWQMRSDPFRDITELTVVAPDHPRFMSIIAGCCALAGANIVDAQIFTTTDGLALDSITISRAFEQDSDEERRADRIIKSIRQALAGELRLGTAVAAKGAGPKGRDGTFQLETRILIDNAASNRHTLIQVRGMDRPGLLHALTHEIASLSLNIVSAHIATYGEKAIDTFYVTDLTHAKITDATRQEVIRTRLAGVFAGPEPIAPRAA